MTVLPQASLFLGVIPALVLLFIGLKGYDQFYKEKNIFLTFVIGIILGFIAAVIELLTLTVGVLIIILFPILEQILKTMILNVGRLHGKRETVIYGLSLGLGFGSIFTPVSIILAPIQTESIMLLVSIILGSIGIILVHGATGVIIGYGVYIGRLTKNYVFALILHIPVTTWIFLTGIYRLEHLQVCLVLYGIFIYWYATKKIMSRIINRSQRRKKLD
jgi:hypothetical protein